MNINEILSKFNANQLSEINSFLTSAQGKKLSGGISDAEKENLLRQFKGLDSNTIASKLNGLTKDDILKMLK